ncbi:MAG: phosphopyruvate hydratase [Rickettsiaceae bacterium H1]|nr:phosphopyruvate hydratase [Rickettsiaceae bacterium H1]
MPKISKVWAREILDSRGNPTIEVEVRAQKYFGKAQVPSGASVGLHEAMELRDNDKKRFLGKGVIKAIDSVNSKISNLIIGMEVAEQEKIDRAMIDLDGTENKSGLGANAILGVSLAVAKAAAASQEMPIYKYLSEDEKFLMPIPMINIINGGVHANNELDVQEFMIIPRREKSFREMIRKSTEVFHTLKNLLSEEDYSTAVGDEGGFAPSFNSTEQTLCYLVKAMELAGYDGNFSIALDAAASTFYRSDSATYKIDGKNLNYESLTDYYLNLCNKYPVISIEDGMDELDVNGWKYLTKQLGKKIQLVGDDVFVTNPGILTDGIKNNIANAVLIKPNQIGTLTETLETMEIAKKNDYKSIVSHRSGDTEDTIIAHIAVATSCGQIKTGSLCRYERVIKYNELMRIEEELH